MTYFSLQAFVLTALLVIGLLLASLALKRLDILPQAVRQRQSPLDGLRGILASAVVAHHFFITYGWKTAGGWVAPENLLLNNLGAVPVSLFFLITGFLFLGKIEQGGIGWPKLYLSRLKRIMPLYLFVLLVVVALTLHARPLSADRLPEFYRWLKYWLLFRGGAFDGFPSHLVTAGVTWTLLYEWCFYFSLPLLYLCRHRSVARPLWVWLVLAAGWYAWRHTEVRFYLLFVLALPAVWLGGSVRRLMQRYARAVDVLMLVLPVVVLLFTKAYSVPQMLLLAVPFAFLANGYSYFGLLHHDGLRKLGEISFSIYLVHGLLLFATFTLLPLYDFSRAAPYGYLPYFLPLFALTVLCSLGTYWFVERPFLYRRAKRGAG